VANVEAKKKGRPERQRRLLSDFGTFSLSTTFSRDPVFVILLAHVFRGGGGGSLKNSAGKYVVKNRLVASVEEEEARKRWEKGRHKR
jgi:hypothetical protein